ncbi:hypothetical protein C8R44DRAFT_727028 [Mycena epipterygia]|nr:hypothetical protein C8R44DRAFT_727028 [Mycena epipterygia]
MLPHGNQFSTKLVPRMRWRYAHFTRTAVDEMLPPYARTQLAWLLPDGDEIQERIWARVPVRRGVARAYSIDDMDTDLWLDCGRGVGSPVSDLAVHSVHVKRFRPGDVKDMRYTYSVVVTSQRTEGGFVHPVNNNITRLVPELTPRWRGNVLIFRHGMQPGNPIVNIRDGAAELVEEILKTIFRDNLLAHREDLGGHA